MNRERFKHHKIGTHAINNSLSLSINRFNSLSWLDVTLYVLNTESYGLALNYWSLL